jgi:hypothetical protein
LHSQSGHILPIQSNPIHRTGPKDDPSLYLQNSEVSLEPSTEPHHALPSPRKLSILLSPSPFLRSSRYAPLKPPATPHKSHQIPSYEKQCKPNRAKCRCQNQKLYAQHRAPYKGPNGTIIYTTNGCRGRQVPLSSLGNFRL